MLPTRPSTSLPIRLLHAIWVVSALLAAILFVAALQPRFVQLEGDPFGLAEGLAALGFTTRHFALYGTVMDAIAVVICFVLGCFLFWRKPDDAVVLIVSLTFVLSAATVLPITTVLQQPGSPWQLIAGAMRGYGTIVLVAAMLIFPDGRFTPRWTRWFLLGFTLYVLLWVLNPRLAPVTAFTDLSELIEAGTAAQLWRTAPILLTFGLVIVAQAQRYAHAPDLVQRQQTKWVAAGIIGAAATLIMLFTILIVFADLRRSVVPFTLFLLAATPVVIAGYLIFPISVVIAVLRYHLWDIDVIIRRTLIYAALTVTLAVVYFGGIVVLQLLFLRFTGQRSPLALVISTLAIAALFRPLRNRLQRTIDRRFYRRKYDAQRVIEQFAAVARDEPDLEKLLDELCRVAGETVQPTSIAVWINSKAEKN